MIRKVSEIMIKNYISIDALCGIKRVQDIAEKTNINIFPVVEHEKIVGVITEFDLMKSHPNRIALDAMSKKFKYIKEDETVWKAKELLENESEILFVKNKEKIVGIVTKKIIDIEISKHIDLLTNLYKKEYIIYNLIKLLEQNIEVSIIFFDINNFGYIDKKFGHAIGDEILKDVAKLLKHHAPDGTFLCRYGGDEFVLLTNESPESSKELAHNILIKIKQHKFYDNIHISLSAGIAGGIKNKSKNTDLSKTITNLINIASIASTKAKKEKNNLVIGFNGTIDEIAI